MTRLLATLFTICMIAAPASAQETPDARYDRIVREVVQPAFAALAKAAGEQSSAWRAACATPAATDRAMLLERFHATADRWAEAEVFRTGPSAANYRHERFDLWPERKNAVGRGLDALRQAGGSAPTTPEQVAAASAAVQGLPALERLLYDPHLAADACRLGPAIAANAARLAQDMQQAWNTNRAATVDSRTVLASDLATSYAILKDTKIEAVIGKSAATTKPKAAKFWRSGRSLRDIALNLATLSRVARLLASGLPEDAALIGTTRQAQRIAAGLSGDLGAVAAGDRRSDAVLLYDAVDVAADRAVVEVPAALGVTIGFNSLDGD